MRSLKRPSPNIKGGFTLIEVLVASAVFIMLLALLLSLTSEASRLWQQAESQKARRQIARIVLETMARDLESAAFTTNANGVQFLLNVTNRIGAENINPCAAFWQAPTLGGVPGTLSQVGYFVQWVDAKPALCRYYVPATKSESLFSANTNNWSNWLAAAPIASYAAGLKNTNTYDGLLSENVVGLWITLYDSTNGVLSNYDSRATVRRPASAEIGIAVIDPRTAQRITRATQVTSAYTTNADSFPANLSADLRDGVQVFKTRVQFQASSPTP